MGVRSLRERGVEILYKVTLRHAKLWITRFDRFNERGGGCCRGGGGGGGGCPPSADSTSGGGAGVLVSG